jgi:hypothetical protein
MTSCGSSGVKSGFFSGVPSLLLSHPLLQEKGLGSAVQQYTSTMSRFARIVRKRRPLENTN